MDKAKAVQLYQQCARKEPGGGPQLRLGQIYEFGFGVERDYQQAMNWYNHSATDPLAGNLRAEFALGRMYAKGIGVTRNYKKAAEWFGRAAGLRTEKGVEKTREVHRSTEAVCAMAIMYKYGVGVDRNVAKAEQLLHLDLANGESWCREI
jgi:TPR repeat protein